MVGLNSPKQMVINLVFVGAFPAVVGLTTPVTVERVIDLALDNLLIAVGIGLVAVFLVLFAKSSDRADPGPGP